MTRTSTAATQFGRGERRPELSELFRGRRRLLLALPVAAAVLAGALSAITSRDQFRATGRVDVAQAVTEGGDLGPRLQQSVNEFQYLVAGGHVTASVVAGSVASVSATGSSAESATRSLERAVRSALVSLASQQRDQAQVEATADRAAADSLLGQLRDLQQAAGVVNVGAEYQARLVDILSLQNQLVTADPARRQLLQSVYTRKSAELAKYEAAYSDYQLLQSRLDAQNTQVGQASSLLASADARVTRVGSSPTISDPRVAAVSKLPAIAKSAMAAGLVALVLCALLAYTRERHEVREDLERATFDRRGLQPDLDLV